MLYFFPCAILGGSLFRTIQHAVVQAAQGQEIRIAGGFYEESVTNFVNKGGKEGLQFVGSWKADCLVTNCVIRGNSYGVNLSAVGGEGDRKDHFWPRLSHCQIVDNTAVGVECPSCYYMDTCLIARNGGIGINGTQANSMKDSIAVNCTIADNRGSCGINLYHSVLANTNNYCETTGREKLIADEDTVEVAPDKVGFEESPSRAYWPRQKSPAVGLAVNRNSTLAVKVYTDLKDQPLNPKKRYEAGCYQLPKRGLQLFVR